MSDAIAAWARGRREAELAAELAGTKAAVAPQLDRLLAENAELRAEVERLTVDARQDRQSALAGIENFRRERDTFRDDLDAVRRLCDDLAVQQIEGNPDRMALFEFRERIRAVLDSPPSGPEASGVLAQIEAAGRLAALAGMPYVNPCRDDREAFDAWRRGWESQRRADVPGPEVSR